MVFVANAENDHIDLAEIGRPNIFDRCRRFNLTNIYLGIYCLALGGWAADSGLLAQLGGLKTLLSDCHVL